MPVDTENVLAADIGAAGQKARYDAACKNVLSAKIILAWILKFCVEEFTDYDVNDIVGYIEGDPIVSEVGVMPNTTNTEKISGIANEDSSINEGRITYDIIFSVILPTEERIKLIINVEAQNSTHPGYPLKKRIVYYGCRIVSAQYGREFENAEYGNLKKVYTVWICTSPPERLQNKIIGYSIQPYRIIGDTDDGNNDHDIMRCVVVYLGKEEDGDKNGLLRLLEVLFSREKDHTEKKRILHDEYNIEMTSKLDEEVTEMCNLSDGIWTNAYNEGIEQGIEQGMEQGMKQGEAKGRLEMVKNLMRSLSLTAEKALETLCIPKNEWDNYLPKLG